MPDWQTKLFYPGPDNKYTFDEYCMTDLCNVLAARRQLRFKSGWLLSNDRGGAPPLRWGPDAALIRADRNKEVAMHHFKDTKVYPTIARGD